MSQAGRIAKGAGWIYAYRWTERLLSFVSIAVLARLLLPEDFGLVAIASSFVAVLEGLSEFDVKNVLIQAPDEDRELHDSAFTLAAARGALVALAMVAMAPLQADPRVEHVLYALASVPLLNGLGNPRFVLFERKLAYDKLALQTWIATPLSVLVTLLVAWIARSHWALVAGIVVAALVRTITSYTLLPYRPRWSLVRFREIFRFSGWMSLATIVATLSMRTDKILVGHVLGYTAAGVYFMTQRVGVLPTNELISPLQRVLFSSFSRMHGDLGRLRRAVSESINVLAGLSLPAAVGFAFLADDFVPLFLGRQWMPIVPLLQVLVPYLGLRATLSNARPVVMAMGKTRLMFQVSFVYALVHLPCFLVGMSWFGLNGAIGGIVVAGALYIWLNTWLLVHSVGLTRAEMMRQVRRPLLAVACMSLGLWAATIWRAPDGGTLGERDPWDHVGGLVLDVALGGVVYVGVLGLLWVREGRPEGLERRVSGLRVFARRLGRSGRADEPREVLAGQEEHERRKQDPLEEMHAHPEQERDVQQGQADERG